MFIHEVIKFFVADPRFWNLLCWSVAQSIGLSVTKTKSEHFLAILPLPTHL